MQAKGAGKIYLDMIGILLGITLLSWFFTSVIHGNKKIVIYTLLLLTVGTMLQCIFREEQVLKNPQYYETHNPAASLQFQYILGFVMALAAAFLYLNCKNLSSTKALKKLNLSSVKIGRMFFYFSLFLSVITLALAKSVGNVRNWITPEECRCRRQNLSSFCMYLLQRDYLEQRRIQIKKISEHFIS